MATTTISLAAIRRLAVATQAYVPRFRRAPAGDVETVIRRLGAVQLDSISTVGRAHRLTIASRIGAYDEKDLRALLGSGRAFEYWAHEACLLPVELWPHFRRTMDGGGHWGIHDRALLEHADLVEPVLERIRAEGPLASRDFGGTRTSREMWGRTPAKAVLEALWDRGELVIAGRESFQRRYQGRHNVLQMLARVDDRRLTCPSIAELCQRTGDYATLAEVARQQDNPVHFVAGLVAAKQCISRGAETGPPV